MCIKFTPWHLTPVRCLVPSDNPSLGLKHQKKEKAISKDNILIKCKKKQTSPEYCRF